MIFPFSCKSEVSFKDKDIRNHSSCWNILLSPLQRVISGQPQPWKQNVAGVAVLWSRTPFSLVGQRKAVVRENEWPRPFCLCLQRVHTPCAWINQAPCIEDPLLSLLSDLQPLRVTQEGLLIRWGDPQV